MVGFTSFFFSSMTTFRTLYFFSLAIWLAFASVFVEAQGVAQATLFLQNAKDWLELQGNLPSGQPEIMPPDDRIQIPNCAVPFVFGFAFNNPAIVSVSCPEKEWQIYLEVRYLQVSRESVFVTNLSAGHKLEEGDVDSKDPRQTWRGKFLKVAVRAGQEVNNALLEEGITVFRTTQALKENQELQNIHYQSVTVAPSANGTAITDESELVRAKLSGNLPAQSILTRRVIKPFNPIVIVSTPIARGAIVNAENTRVGDFWGRPPSDSISDMNAIPRAVATTQLMPGQPLRLSQIRSLPTIRKGDNVEVRISRNLVTITSTMVAEDSGELGEKITLRNSDSGRVVEAIVTGVGRATIP
jgi:flagella basal body P-ring formation protein FlgA